LHPESRNQELSHNSLWLWNGISQPKIIELPSMFDHDDVDYDDIFHNKRLIGDSETTNSISCRMYQGRNVKRLRRRRMRHHRYLKWLKRMKFKLRKIRLTRQRKKG